MSDNCCNLDFTISEPLNVQMTISDANYMFNKNIKAFDTVADMQAATLESGDICHTNGFHTSGDGGAAFYKVVNSGSIQLNNGLYATRVNSGATKISLEELATVGNGVYTLGTVTVNNPVLLSGIQNRNIVIVDTVFNINTPVLFPRTGNASYWTLPSFVGCTFNNMTNGRVLVASGDTNMVGSRITGCNFVNVDMASGTYLQDYDFTSCYIQSCQAFLECANSTVQARFVNCNVESESKKIVVSRRAVVYLNGVFEGNESTDWHFFEFTYGIMLLDGAWIEGANFADIVGSSTITEKTVISIIGSNLAAGTNPLFKITNTGNVYIYIFGSQWQANSSSSRICLNAPNEFGGFIGSFRNYSANSYNSPWGGVDSSSYEIATEHYVGKAIESLNQQYIGALLATTPISVVLPCGLWKVTIARFRGAVDGLVEYEYLIWANTPYSLDTSILKTQTIPTTDAYLNSVVITATKQTTADTTFTLEISATLVAAYHVSISKA